MAIVTLALASTLLAFGPQVVLSFNSISFSTVQQCGNFSVKFSGGKLPASLPLLLTVVPFNFTPIAIEIPTFNWNNTTLTGAAVTFLPFPADAQFVASLDDANGIGTGPVSDIMRIDSSSDSSCLSSGPTPARYELSDSPTQCRDFHVAYDPTVVDEAPEVRAFVPKGPSVFLNQDVPGSAVGSAAYSMAAAQGEQVVLMFSDDTGFKQTTDLLVVGGNSSSPTNCLPSASPTPMAKNHSSSSVSHGLSKGGIIAISVVCVVVVAVIALAMSYWFCRERRRIRNTRRGDAEGRQVDALSPTSHQMKISLLSPGARNVPFDPSLLNSKPLPTIHSKPLPSPPSIASWSAVDDASAVIHIRNPPYTRAMLDLASPTTPASGFSQMPMPDVSRARPPSIPIPIITPQSSLSVLDEAAVHDFAPLTTRNGRGAATPSMSTDDIENILDMATMYAAPGTPGTMRSSILRGSSPGTTLPLWTISQGARQAATSPSPAEELTQPTLTIEPPAPTPSLLTPLTASTQREPPQAQLPSSPVPSTMSTGFPPPSIDELSTRIASVGNFEFLAPRP